jgi:prepilin-type N-terminal cleavage/methylation domain-containing protein
MEVSDVSRKAVAGFSLIELMVTLMLMGLLLSMTVPAISSYANSSRLAGARSVLMSDLRLARSLATAQRTNYEVRLDSTSYSIRRLSPAQTILTRRLPRGIGLAHRDTASFYPWGLTETMTITLRQGTHNSIVRTASNGQVSHD